jgi:hypothetical protein
LIVDDLLAEASDPIVLVGDCCYGLRKHSCLFDIFGNSFYLDKMHILIACVNGMHDCIKKYETNIPHIFSHDVESFEKWANGLVYQGNITLH